MVNISCGVLEENVKRMTKQKARRIQALLILFQHKTHKATCRLSSKSPQHSSQIYLVPFPVECRPEK
jgi:hypothetical protein